MINTAKQITITPLQILLLTISVIFICMTYFSLTSYAQSALDPICNGSNKSANCVVCGTGKGQVQCGDYKSLKNCNAENGCNIVEKYINPAINMLAVIVGLLAVISIMIGGVQFASSDGDPQKAAAAKGRIAKTIVALVSFMFLYAFLQFLVPGGIFNG